MTVYNPSRRDEQLLADYADSPPSFTVKFFPEHWLINNSRPNLYHTPISFLLDDIRERRIPPDWLQSFDQHGVTFYDGCLIVELEDHRDGPEKTSKERIVLPMDAESLWTDIRLERERSGKITTEEEALDLEARLLAATSPPLCLDPDPIVTRIANTALRAGALETPTAFRKKDAAAENERGNAIKARQAKIMSLMNPHATQPRLPRAPLFDVIQRKRTQPQSLVPHIPQHMPFQNPDPHAVSIGMQVQALHQQQPQEAAVETIASGQNNQMARKKIILKQGSKSEEIPMQSATPETPVESSQMPGSAQIKRKASLTAPTPPPPQQKKKPNGIKPSSSVEATPVPGPSQLPVVQQQQAPQPVAYQLNPSTAAAFPPNSKPKLQMPVKKIPQPQVQQVKKEPHMGRPMMMPGQGQPGMLPGQIPMGLTVGQTPSQQHVPLPGQNQVNQNQSKPSTPAPAAPTLSAQHQLQQQTQHAQQHQMNAQQQQQQAQAQQQLQSQQQMHPHQFAQQAAMLAGANNPTLAAAAAQFQQQHAQAMQAQAQAQAQAAAAASPRPGQQGLPQNAAQLQASQFTFSQQTPAAAMALRMRAMHEAQQAARMNQANMAALNFAQNAAGGQMNPQLQQQMAAMGMMGVTNQAQLQQLQQHQQQIQHQIQQQQQQQQAQQGNAASPQIQHQSPHPGVAQVPSRPGSVMPAQQNNTPQQQQYYQTQIAMARAAQLRQQALAAQQLQAQQQQQAQLNAMNAANFQLQLPPNAMNGNAAAMMGGMNGQQAAAFAFGNPAAQQAYLQQRQQQMAAFQMRTLQQQQQQQQQQGQR